MNRRNLHHLFRRGVRSVEAYGLVQERAAVKLNQNESPFDIPAPVKEEIFERLRGASWNRYTQQVPERVAQKLADLNNWPVEGVVLGAGSNLLLELLAFSVLRTGECVLAPKPCFSLYGLISTLAEADFREIPFGDRFSYDNAAWEAAVERCRPRLVFICSPNNPTGSFLELSQLEGILRKVQGITVVDEAYHEFAGENARGFLDRFPHLVLVRTFSKAYSGAGLRLGYMLADPDVAGEIRKIVPPFNINILTATAAEVLLERPALKEENVKKILSEKKRVMETLEKQPSVEVFPSRANFFLLRTGMEPAVIAREFASRDVLIRVVKGEGLEGTVRVTIGTRDENDRFLDALFEILRDFQEKRGKV